jgi:hypothetical protein
VTILLNSSWNEKCLTKVVDKTKAQILRSITFFNEKHAVYENFANMMEPKGPQMTP